MPENNNEYHKKARYFESESDRKHLSRLSFLWGSNIYRAVSVLVLVSLIGGLYIVQQARESKAAVATKTYNATADTYISKPIPSQTLNTAKDLWVRGGTTRTSEIYLKFDVSGIGTKKVTSAKLKLYHLENPAPSGGQAYRITWDWSYNPTWSKNPGVPTNATKLGELGRVDKSYTYYDMTLVTTGWKDGVNTIVLKSNVDDGVNYSSAQGSRAPQLILVTDDSTTTTTPTTGGSTGGTTGGTTGGSTGGSTGGTTTPTIGTTYDEPFPKSVLRRPAANVAYDSRSAEYVSIVLGAAANTNSGRGPSIFSTGEKRFRSLATDPLWTFKATGSGGSTTVKANINITDSGSADPTIGIYDDSTGKVVRMWGGDSKPINFLRTTSPVATGTNIGWDTNGDGLPEGGIGTAWGRMSGEGLMIASDKTKLDHRVKFALGNNLLNRNLFRAPAISAESKAGTTGVIPMGLTLCHLWTTAEIDVFQDKAKLAQGSNERIVSDSFTEGMSCTRGYGMTAGDGTGTSGFNLYISNSELGITEDQSRRAIRMPNDGNIYAGYPNASDFWKDTSKWRALIPG